MVQSDGCRCLGGAVGEKEFCSAFVTSLVDRWCKDLRTLAALAQTQPILFLQRDFHFSGNTTSDRLSVLLKPLVLWTTSLILAFCLPLQVVNLLMTSRRGRCFLFQQGLRYLWYATSRWMKILHQSK